jgi:tetratricopeptide (TPR) repeat protein
MISKFAAKACLAALLISVCSYADGLPGEYILSLRWRDLLAGHSPLTNPAFMTQENFFTVRGAFSSTVNNAFKLWELGATVPLGKYQSIGLTWAGEDDGSIENAASDLQTGELLPSGNAVSNQNHFGLLSYSINPWRRLSIGVNLTILRFGNFDNPVTGYGLDVGASYGLPHHNLLGDNLFGLMLQNIVAPKVDIAGDEAVSPLLRLSWLTKLWDERIESGLDFNVKDFVPKTSDFTSTGNNAAWRKKLETEFNYRLGAWMFRRFKVYGLVGSDYWGLALGAAMPSVDKGTGWSFMYQYMSLDKNDDAISNTFYLIKELGNGRSGGHAKPLNMEPNDLYNKAMRLYQAGEYWDAFFVFSRIYSGFPDFFMNDRVSYYRGQCLEELDMRKQAEEIYVKARKEYPRSSAMPDLDLGLMRIYYRNGSFSDVSTQFKRLNVSKAPDSIKFHAEYYMGNAQMQNDQNSKAASLLGSIPSYHPMYLFARHSQAVAAIRSGDKVGALMALDKCLDAPTSGNAEKMIVDRSLLFMGYMYYEDNALPKAVKALRAVSSDSYYYTDALLGLGWSAVRARNIDNCISVGEKISAVSPVPAVRLEGMLIAAYGHFVSQDYKKTISILEIASNILDTLSPLSQDSLAKTRERYGLERASYDIFSKEADNIAVNAKANPVEEKNIDAMHKKQVTFKNNLAEKQRSIDEFSRTIFFSRGLENVRQDINYMMAVVKNISARSGQIDAKAKGLKENEKIDEQIRKLEQQLKNH